MKTCLPALVILFVLNFLKDSLGQQLVEISFPLKRMGAECVLSEYGVNKNNNNEILDKLMDVERTVGTCFGVQLRDHINRLQEEERETQGNTKDSQAGFENNLKFYCGVVNELTECLQPLEISFRKCTHTGGIAFLTLAKEVCQKNRSPLIEYMISSEKWCEELKDRHAFQNCLDKNFNSKTKDLNDLINYISKDTCKAASDLKECSFVYLDQCKGTEPKKIVEKYLNELRKKSPEAEKCFLQTSAEQAKKQLSPLPTEKPSSRSGQYGSRKNFSPREFW